MAYTLLDKIEPVKKDIKKPDTFWTKIKKHLSMSFLKDVLVVAGIVLILSLSFVTKNIVQMIPKMGNEIGEITIIGNLFKSLIGGLLFFVVKLII